MRTRGTLLRSWRWLKQRPRGVCDCRTMTTTAPLPSGTFPRRAAACARLSTTTSNHSSIAVFSEGTAFAKTEARLIPGMQIVEGEGAGERRHDPGGAAGAAAGCHQSFRLGRLLGGGRFAVVKEGMHAQRKTKCAVKIVEKKGCGSQEGAALTELAVLQHLSSWAPPVESPSSSSPSSSSAAAPPPSGSLRAHPSVQRFHWQWGAAYARRDSAELFSRLGAPALHTYFQNTAAAIFMVWIFHSRCHSI